ncbi:MAG: urease accessory protein UreE, partial [Zhenhengia sp.]
MIIEKVIGNIEDKQDIQAFHIEKVILESDGLLKRIQRVKTDHGTELGISLS